VTVRRNKFLFNKTNRRINFSKFIFVKKALRVSGSSSAHHQESSTVHSALVCHAGLMTAFMTYTSAEYTVNKLLMMGRGTAGNG
jgi:hypothetical protein